MHLKISSAKWRPFCPGNWDELLSKSSSSGWVQKRLCILAKHQYIPSVGISSAGSARSHYNDVIMSTMASQITSLTIVYSTVYLGVDKRKHQSSASLVFVREIHRGPVNSPHKGPVTRKMFVGTISLWIFASVCPFSRWSEKSGYKSPWYLMVSVLSNRKDVLK